MSAYTIQVREFFFLFFQAKSKTFVDSWRSGKKFIPDEQGTFMEWSFEGVTCHGVFKPEASVAIFNFTLQESMVTITYRAVDANSCVGLLSPPLGFKKLTSV